MFLLPCLGHLLLLLLPCLGHLLLLLLPCLGHLLLNQLAVQGWMNCFRFGVVSLAVSSDPFVSSFLQFLQCANFVYVLLSSKYSQMVFSFVLTILLDICLQTAGWGSAAAEDTFYFKDMHICGTRLSMVHESW